MYFPVIWVVYLFLFFLLKIWWCIFPWFKVFRVYAIADSNFMLHRQKIDFSRLATRNYKYQRVVWSGKAWMSSTCWEVVEVGKTMWAGLRENHHIHREIMLFKVSKFGPWFDVICAKNMVESAEHGFQNKNENIKWKHKTERT